MGQDRDVLILAWLARRPSGAALADEITSASADELDSLESRGLIARIPSREPGGKHGFVITPEGTILQSGD